MKQLPFFVCIYGPTAVGKSELAQAICQLLPCEIVSVDATQVYRGLDIGSGKPSLATRQSIAHHLIDIRDPAQPYSAADFAKDASEKIAQISARGRIPLLVGGTQFYFRALLYCLDPLPAANPELRKELAAQCRANGPQALHKRLAQLDPEAANRIHERDSQRVQRALEIALDRGGEACDRTAQNWRDRPIDEVSLNGNRYSILQLAMTAVRRELLHERIEKRFERMLADGLLDEVQALRSRNDLNLTVPAMRAIGYHQAWLHLDGQLSREEMLLRAVQATRQLAKRQLTWLRGWPGLYWLQREAHGSRQQLAQPSMRQLCEQSFQRIEELATGSRRAA